jgi:hypothetical protein
MEPLLLERSCLALMLLLNPGYLKADPLPAAPDLRAKLADHEVTVVKRIQPDFVAKVAGKASLGMFSDSAMASAGNEIVRANGISDPAILIGETLRDTLNRSFNTTSSTVEVATARLGVPAVCDVNHYADLLIDVRTISWSFSYYPSNWDHYGIKFSASIRLIDVKKRKLLGEQVCEFNPADGPDAPTKEELLADHAARLKLELKKAVDFCVADVKARVLAL